MAGKKQHAPTGKRRIWFAGLAVLGMLAGCDDQPPLQPGQCEIQTFGRMHLWSLQNIPVVQTKIDGKPVLFMVDTGAFNSVLFKNNAKSLNLTYTGATAHTRGVRGDEMQSIVKVDKLDLGTGSTTDHVFMLTESPGPQVKAPLPPIVGLLGAEFLLAYDLVIDMPHHAMYLLDMRRCPYVTPMWKGTVHAVPIEDDRDDNKIRMNFTIDNSKPIPAILDTGAYGITIPYHLAHRKIGITRDDLKKDRFTTDVHGIGDDDVTSYIHEFSKLDLGDFEITNVKVEIDDADNIDYALFGARFLHSARIWLTTKNKLYVQHISEMQDAPPIPMAK
ncbi:aspartyl protease family protein [Asaia krungthepensis]|nr:aspartyl protease family protein [Asaia krungthepensis]